MKRRLRRGQCFHQPYFGCREFPAKFREWQEETIPTIEDTKDLGYMLWDLDFCDVSNIQPLFFRARMEKGVLDLTDCEVVR